MNASNCYFVFYSKIVIILFSKLECLEDFSGGVRCETLDDRIRDLEKYRM